MLDSGSLRSRLLWRHTATASYGAHRSKGENRADLAVSIVWSLNPDCINSLFWFLVSTLCLSFLHSSVSVFFPFFVIPASYLSLALLSNHSLAISFTLYPASHYHLRCVKTLSFLRIILCVPYCLILYLYTGWGRNN